MDLFPILISGLCGLLLLALIGALIFSQTFRNDVLAGEGEASVLGVLSVKGVAIVLLCGLFLGGLLYPLRFVPDNNNELLPRSIVDRDYLPIDSVRNNYLRKEEVNLGYISKAEVADNYVLRQGQELVVHGIVQDEQKNGIAGARVTVIAGEGRSKAEKMTDAMGIYFVKLENVAPGEEGLRIVVAKDGFPSVEHTRPYAYDRLTLPITMTKAGDN